MRKYVSLSVAIAVFLFLGAAFSDIAVAEEAEAFVTREFAGISDLMKSGHLNAGYFKTQGLIDKIKLNPTLLKGLAGTDITESLAEFLSANFYLNLSSMMIAYAGSSFTEEEFILGDKDNVDSFHERTGIPLNLPDSSYPQETREFGAYLDKMHSVVCSVNYCVKSSIYNDIFTFDWESKNWNSDTKKAKAESLDFMKNLYYKRDFGYTWQKSINVYSAERSAIRKLEQDFKDAVKRAFQENYISADEEEALRCFWQVPNTAPWQLKLQHPSRNIHFTSLLHF